MSRGGKQVDNLRKLFSFNTTFKWDDGYTFASSNFLKPGDEINMCLLSQKHLLEQSIKQGLTSEVLDSFKTQLTGIKIKIEYEDVLGNPQQPLNVGW